MAAPNEVLIWEQCCHSFALIRLHFIETPTDGGWARANLRGSDAFLVFSPPRRLHFNLYYVITISSPEAINYFPFGGRLFCALLYAFKVFLLLHSHHGLILRDTFAFPIFAFRFVLSAFPL